MRNGSIAFIFYITAGRKSQVKKGEKMARHYKCITFSDRREIATLYQTNAHPTDIAGRLDVITATIYRKLKRGETGGAPVLDQNRWRTYNPVVVQQTVQANFSRWGGPQRMICKEVSTAT